MKKLWGDKATMGKINPASASGSLTQY